MSSGSSVSVTRPVDLPQLRRDLIDWYATPFARSFLVEDKFVAPQGIDRIVDLYRDHLDRATLYYVAPDMVELARAACISMPDFAVEEEDLPSRVGLIYFGAPAVYASNEIPHIAALWSVTRDGTGVSTWYAGRTAYPGSPDEVRRLFPTLMHSIYTTWSSDLLGMEFLDLDPRRVLKAVWLLMQQSVASVETAEYDRASKRRLVKQGIEPPAIRVINLRRSKLPESYENGDREYRHRWVVRGHWRQQYYPTRDVHRPLWIAPHVKGPDGAPLLGGEKVYAWTR